MIRAPPKSPEHTNDRLDKPAGIQIKITQYIYTKKNRASTKTDPYRFRHAHWHPLPNENETKKEMKNIIKLTTHDTVCILNEGEIANYRSCVGPYNSHVKAQIKQEQQRTNQRVKK